MSRSPGHQRWPEHKVKERHVRGRVRAELDGEVVAESTDVIVVEEDDQPARYYFPRGDVRVDKLERTGTTNQCPFKGMAHYYDLKRSSGDRVEDAVWTYEDPYEEHVELKDRLAFYEDKIPGIAIRPSP